MSRYDDDNDVVLDGPGRFPNISPFDRDSFRLVSALPTISTTDNTTANITDYPMNYGDPTSPVDGVPELRSYRQEKPTLHSFFRRFRRRPDRG